MSELCYGKISRKVTVRNCYSRQCRRAHGTYFALIPRFARARSRVFARASKFAFVGPVFYSSFLREPVLPTPLPPSPLPPPRPSPTRVLRSRAQLCAAIAGRSKFLQRSKTAKRANGFRPDPPPVLLFARETRHSPRLPRIQWTAKPMVIAD